MKENLFLKNVSRPSNPPDELAQSVSKKIPPGRIIPPFFSKVQNLTVFSIIYMIRIRFFGPGELNQRTFSAAQYTHFPKNKNCDIHRRTNITKAAETALAQPYFEQKKR